MIDVIRNTDCPSCGAKKCEPCKWEEDKIPHLARVRYYWENYRKQDRYSI